MYIALKASDALAHAGVKSKWLNQKRENMQSHFIPHEVITSDGNVSDEFKPLTREEQQIIDDINNKQQTGLAGAGVEFDPDTPQTLREYSQRILNKPSAYNNLTIRTVMKDREMLLKALGDYGCEFTAGQDRISAEYGDYKFSVIKNPEGIYEIVFHGYLKRHIAENFCNELQELYAMNVQDRVYRNLVERAAERGLILETEENGEDNSIVLTFVVDGG